MDYTRKRFAWTWAGILAGVTLGGASYATREASAESTPPTLQLVQYDPNTAGSSTSPQETPDTTQGTTPEVMPETPVPGTLSSDAGVGGAGREIPPSTMEPDGGLGTVPPPSTTTTPEVGSDIGGSGVPPASVGGLDGGTGF
ncbi:hypothetical protein P2318_02290 [Myxococcaceae bacterium GXIMD 01537]